MHPSALLKDSVAMLELPLKDSVAMLELPFLFDSHMERFLLTASVLLVLGFKHSSRMPRVLTVNSGEKSAYGEQ